MRFTDLRRDGTDNGPRQQSAQNNCSSPRRAEGGNGSTKRKTVVPFGPPSGSVSFKRAINETLNEVREREWITWMAIFHISCPCLGKCGILGICKEKTFSLCTANARTNREHVNHGAGLSVCRQPVPWKSCRSRVSETGNWESDAARFIASKLCFYSFMAARDRKTYSIKFAHKARGAGSSDSGWQAPAHIKRFRGLFGGFCCWEEHLRESFILQGRKPQAGRLLATEARPGLNKTLTR